MKDIPHYDRPVADTYPELYAAKHEANKARMTLIETMERHFPVGTRVRVTHDNGSYTGTVVHSRDESKIRVQNDKTGKSTHRYPLMQASHDNPVPAVEIIRE